MHKCGKSCQSYSPMWSLHVTLQAMLMAFITMNTSNSGIPSAKANSINRTFPPLFTFEIPEEEKIVEDLQ